MKGGRRRCVRVGDTKEERGAVVKSRVHARDVAQMSDALRIRLKGVRACRKEDKGEYGYVRIYS